MQSPLPPTGLYSYHKWALNLGLVNAIKGAGLLVLASAEVKHRSHLLPAQPWVTSAREGDAIAGVVALRPLLLCAQAAKHVAQGEGGTVALRVAGVADVGFCGRALEVRQGGVRWEDTSLLEDSPYHYPAMPRERLRATNALCAAASHRGQGS